MSYLWEDIEEKGRELHRQNIHQFQVDSTIRLFTPITFIFNDYRVMNIQQKAIAEYLRDYRKLVSTILPKMEEKKPLTALQKELYTRWNDLHKANTISEKFPNGEELTWLRATLHSVSAISKIEHFE